MIWSILKKETIREDAKRGRQLMFRRKLGRIFYVTGNDVTKEEHYVKKVLYTGLLVFAVLAMAACGQDDKGKITSGQYYNPQKAKEQGETEQANEDTAGGNTAQGQQNTGNAQGEGLQIDTGIFMITQNDMQEEVLLLEQVATGKQYMYHYTLATRFLDKYGNRTSVSNFDAGRVIEINEKDSWGKVTEVQVSDEVWEYPDVTRFLVDEERGVFTIADTRYEYDERLLVTSGESTQKLSDLTEMDELRVIGIEKKILSVSVTTGHGTLRLENTELFDGSFIQIGERIFTEITGPMSIDIAEGTYLVTVANNGYGGSTEITIERGEEVLLNLDTLKGEGPKFGSILFAVDVPDAILQIDGKVIDYTEEIPLQYGIHTLTVTAAGYDTYSKKLFVNSETATIVIAMSGEDSSGTSESTSGTSDQAEQNETASEVTAGSLAGSQAGTHGSAGSTDSSGSSSANSAMSEAELDVLVDELLNDDDDDTSSSDYLSTVSELLSAISGSDD